MVDKIQRAEFFYELEVKHGRLGYIFIVYYLRNSANLYYKDKQRKADKQSGDYLIKN